MYIENHLLDHTRPYDHEPIKRLPEYIRETRRSIFVPGVREAQFETGTVTGDAVYFDPLSEFWRRSLSGDEPRAHFHGIAHVELAQVRLFGLFQNPAWNFTRGQPVYVSSTTLGKLVQVALPEIVPSLVVAGRAIATDIMLLETQIYPYLNQLRVEVLEARDLVLAARDETLVYRNETFVTRNQAVGAAATATTAACAAEHLVTEATAGFTGFLDDLAYDFGCITAPCTYFDQNWGSITDPVTP